MERHGGRDGRALPQHKRRVLWAGDNLRAALVRNRRSFQANIGSSSRGPSCERRKREREATFPSFDCTEAAEHVHRRIRATTTYMRVTHSAREETKRAEKRRAEERHAAEREAKRAAGEQRAREVEERRAAERRERADRTEGPAARTRERSTRPRIIAAARGVAKERGLVRAPKRRCRALDLA